MPEQCLNMPEQARICWNMPEYAYKIFIIKISYQGQKILLKVGGFCFTMITRADIEALKDNVS